MMDLNKLKAILRDDEVVEQISEAAHNSLRNHLRQVRGQMITPADSIELHVMHATIDALIQEYKGWVCVPQEADTETADIIKSLMNGDGAPFLRWDAEYLYRRAVRNAAKQKE